MQICQDSNNKHPLPGLALHHSERSWNPSRAAYYVLASKTAPIIIWRVKKSAAPYDQEWKIFPFTSFLILWMRPYHWFQTVCIAAVENTGQMKLLQKKSCLNKWVLPHWIWPNKMSPGFPWKFRGPIFVPICYVPFGGPGRGPLYFDQIECFNTLWLCVTDLFGSRVEEICPRKHKEAPKNPTQPKQHVKKTCKQWEWTTNLNWWASPDFWTINNVTSEHPVEFPLPIPSMYGIFTYIYHKNQPFK